jgi:hypothetical protein
MTSAVSHSTAHAAQANEPVELARYTITGASA